VLIISSAPPGRRRHATGKSSRSGRKRTPGQHARLEPAASILRAALQLPAVDRRRREALPAGTRCQPRRRIQSKASACWASLHAGRDEIRYRNGILAGPVSGVAGECRPLPRKVLDLVATFARTGRVTSLRSSTRRCAATVRQPALPRPRLDVDNERATRSLQGRDPRSVAEIGDATKARTMLPHRRQPKFYPKPRSLPSTSRTTPPRRTVAAVRVVEEAAAVDPHRFRGILGLRLPLQTERKGQSERSPHQLSAVRKTTNRNGKKRCRRLSRDAILQGSFDSTPIEKAKRGTATVDASSLKKSKAWRLELAKNIALRNPKIGTANSTTRCRSPSTDHFPADVRRPRHRAVRPTPGPRRHATCTPNSASSTKADQPVQLGPVPLRPGAGPFESPDTSRRISRSTTQVLKPILKGLTIHQSLRVSVLRRNPGPGVRAFLGKVIRLTEAIRRSGREAGGEEGRRRLLHADLHRRFS